ncbi:DEAD/DEAH box helicase [Streptomyces argenteolus]
MARLRSLLPERTPAAPAPRREPRLPETMDVFGIHADLIKEYEDFTKSATVIRDARIEGFVAGDLAAKSQWPDPWLSLNPFFADGGQVTDLVRDGLLHPRCAEIFQAGKKENARRPDGRPLTFHLHQRQAIEAAQVDDSYVLTTGTGSGKSLAYIVPIVDRVLKERQAAGAGGGGRVRAIVVYPMNALANSQLGELEKYLRHGFGTGASRSPSPATPVRSPTSSVGRLLPLFEAKMLHHYDHRFSTYEDATEKQLAVGTLPRLTVDQHQDASAMPLPRYWVPEQDVPTGEVDKNGQPIMESGVRSRLAAKGWDRQWVFGWRDICRASDERTMIAAAAPAHGFGHKFLLALSSQAALMGAAWSSFVMDYATRQSVGGTSMSYFIVRQLPMPSPEQLTPHSGMALPRLLQLTYPTHDMRPFALDLGDSGAPFRWDPDRRAVIRAELDALFFHLYGITRDDTAYILDTFNVTRDNDTKAHGEYRTKRLILAEYDRMAAAGLTLETPLTEDESGTYRSTLTPPPGQGSRHSA